MIAAVPTVFLVDDDAAVLKALARVLRGEGWTVETFESAEAFLARREQTAQGCLVLDVNLPGLDGLALQQRLAEAGQTLPIVFLTGQGDIPMSVQAIKAGAADFLTKPVQAAALIDAVRSAVDQDVSARQARVDIATLRQRYAISRRASAKCWRRSRRANSTSRSPTILASSSRRSSSIARASCGVCKRARSPN